MFKNFLNQFFLEQPEQVVPILAVFLKELVLHNVCRYIRSEMQQANEHSTPTDKHPKSSVKKGQA